MAHRHMAHGSCVLRHVMDTPVTAPHRAHVWMCSGEWGSCRMALCRHYDEILMKSCASSYRTICTCRNSYMY